MSRRHWLDPLARQVLKATGHLPNSRKTRTSNSKEIERALKALKSTQRKLEKSPSFFVDVNRAKRSDWQKLKGCTEAMIDLLLRLQNGGVQLSCSEDLCLLLELPDQLVEQWNPHLVFRWYGDSPPLPDFSQIDLNNADLECIKKNLNWSNQLINKLLKERQRKPFEHLADLQERMCLAPSKIEELIGNVRFGSRHFSPTLPPDCKNGRP